MVSSDSLLCIAAPLCAVVDRLFFYLFWNECVGFPLSTTLLQDCYVGCQSGCLIIAAFCFSSFETSDLKEKSLTNVTEIAWLSEI